MPPTVGQSYLPKLVRCRPHLAAIFRRWACSGGLVPDIATYAQLREEVLPSVRGAQPTKLPNWLTGRLPRVDRDALRLLLDLVGELLGPRVGAFAILTQQFRSKGQGAAEQLVDLALARAIWGTVPGWRATQLEADKKRRLDELRLRELPGKEAKIRRAALEVTVPDDFSYWAIDLAQRFVWALHREAWPALLTGKESDVEVIRAIHAAWGRCHVDTSETTDMLGLAAIPPVTLTDIERYALVASAWKRPRNEWLRLLDWLLLQVYPGSWGPTVIALDPYIRATVHTWLRCLLRPFAARLSVQARLRFDRAGQERRVDEAIDGAIAGFVNSFQLGRFTGTDWARTLRNAIPRSIIPSTQDPGDASASGCSFSLELFGEVADDLSNGQRSRAGVLDSAPGKASSPSEYVVSHLRRWLSCGREAMNRKGARHFVQDAESWAGSCDDPSYSAAEATSRGMQRRRYGKRDAPADDREAAKLISPYSVWWRQKRWFTVLGLAHELEVTEHTLRNWDREGRLVPLRTKVEGKLFRLYRDDQDFVRFLMCLLYPKLLAQVLGLSRTTVDRMVRGSSSGTSWSAASDSVRQLISMIRKAKTRRIDMDADYSWIRGILKR